MPYLDNLSVLSAKWQTAGRGQRGNTWEARASENLTFSILLKFGQGTLPYLPALPSKEQFHLNMALTVALTDYLKGHDINAKIKWPNDIYCGDGKLCGVLIENTLNGGTMASCVLGVGLNVNQVAFSPELPNPTSMALQTGLTYDTGKELGDFLRVFDGRLESVFTAQGRAELLQLYLSRLYRLYREHSFIRVSDMERFKGRIMGITQDARLVVEHCDTGGTEEFSFKEIKYVIDGREQV